MKKCPFCAEEIQDEAARCRYCRRALGDAGAASGAVPPAPASAAPPAPAKVAAAEKTYFSDGSVRITSTRAVFGQRTYAMANITSVSLSDVNLKGTRQLGWGLLIVGVLLSLTGVGALIGIPLGVAGIVMARAKDEHIVRFGSSSGEANALVHSDRAYIEQIVNATSRAIVDRG